MLLSLSVFIITPVDDKLFGILTDSGDEPSPLSLPLALYGGGGVELRLDDSVNDCNDCSDSELSDKFAHFSLARKKFEFFNPFCSISLILSLEDIISSCKLVSELIVSLSSITL